MPICQTKIRTPRRRRVAQSGVVAAITAAALLSLGVTGSSATTVVPVPPEATPIDGAWPYPNHDLGNSRDATGSAITSANVATLKESWRLPVSTGLPTSPVIVGTSAYVQEATGRVYKVDLATGKVLWKSWWWGSSDGPNGVTVGWGKVFGTTARAVFALNSTTGKLLWWKRIAHGTSDGVTIQPQLVGHTVIASSVPVIGATLYKAGNKGFIDALDEQTGKLRWDFDTIQSSNLWGHPEINSGGGAWFPPSYSPDTGLLYVGIGNPGPFVGLPDFPNGSSRPGDNLYTDSIVALDLQTGGLAWYQQAHPHDLFDHDFMLSMVANIPASGSQPASSVVVGTGKGGVVIGMDPTTGARLWSTPVGVHQNDDLTALIGPTTVLPGTLGGVLTPPASADGQVFVAAINAPSVYSPTSTIATPSLGTMQGDVVAMDAKTGTTVWDTKITGDPTGAVTVVNDLVLTATLQGTVYALSRSTGAIVWQTNAPGGINGSMSVAGNSIVIPVGRGTPMLWTLKLPS
jgi:glucose dehydrogenase